MTSKEKVIIKKALRFAIKCQNRKVLFSCEDCGFYDGACELDPENRTDLSMRQPTQLPQCFAYNVIESAFAGVLEVMAAMEIDFHEAKHGWPTVVGRLASRANRFGYVDGVSQRNLEKYG